MHIVDPAQQRPPAQRLGPPGFDADSLNDDRVGMTTDGQNKENSDSQRTRKTLTHVDEQGAAHMVDVGSKPITVRTAEARGVCAMQPATAEAIRNNSAAKGDVLAVARVAGVMAAKRTDGLIPLCHSLPLDSVTVDFEWESGAHLVVTARVACTGRTGVEMEALVAVSVASLTVYDMCKSMDREMSIERVELVRKSGGASGDFRREF